MRTDEYASRRLKYATDPVWRAKRIESQRRCTQAARSSPEGRMEFLIYTANWRARRRGEPYGVALEDLVPLPTVCPVLGITLNYAGNGGKGWTAHSASLDRIVPSAGYVAGNVRVISMRANSLRLDATHDELYAVALDARRLVAQSAPRPPVTRVFIA